MVSFLLSVAFVVWVVILVVWDFRARRLPDFLTLPGACVIGVWALFVDPWLLAGGAAWFLLYLFTAGVIGGIGGGDIKFALGLGTVVAAGGVGAWMVAVVGASLISVLLAVVYPEVRRIPHGPGMALATCMAVALYWEGNHPT